MADARDEATGKKAPLDPLEALKALGPAFFDAWYVVDAEDRIVDFNAAFHALFPRSVGRNLKRLTCREALSLPYCRGEKCLREQCASGALRLDEIDAEVAGESLRLILSVVPLTLADGQAGALIVLRNVTDEARVQARYQQMMEVAEKQRQELELRLAARTRELLAANTELNELTKELKALKRGAEH